MVVDRIALRERSILGFAVRVQLERGESFSNVRYGNSVEIFCCDCAEHWLIIMIDEAAFELRDCSVHEDCVFYEIGLLCSKTWRSCLHTVIFMSWFWFWSLVKMTRMIDFYYSKNQSISWGFRETTRHT